MRCLQRWPPLRPAQWNLRHSSRDPSLHVPLWFRLPSFSDGSESRVTTASQDGFCCPCTFPSPQGFLRLPLFLDNFMPCILLRPPDSSSQDLLILHRPSFWFLLLWETLIGTSWTPIFLSFVKHIHYVLSTTITSYAHVGIITKV